MNLGQILRGWRLRVRDTQGAAYAWSDEEGRYFANCAEREAAERGLLLHADAEPASVSVTLTQVEGVATAHAVAHPFYTGQRLRMAGATPSDYNVTPIITSIDADNFTFPVKHAATSPATGSITATLVAGAMCNLTTVVGRATYPLDDKIIQVRAATFNGKTICGRPKSYLDRLYSPLGWKTKTGSVTDFIDPHQQQITLFRIPTVDGVVHLEVDHYPLADMVLDSDVPELPPRFHDHFIDWMEYLSFNKDDTERVDLPRADRAAARFAAVFGPKVDYNTQREQRARASALVCMNPGW